MNEELKVIISAEVSKLKQGVENAKQQLNTFKSKVADAKKDVDSKFKAIGTSISTAAKNMGVGIAAAGAALLGVAASTEEYRNQQAQLISSFEAAGKSAEAATETYNGLYRVLGDGGQAQEAAQHLAKLGVEEQHLNEYTFALQGVFATFGASLPLEGLTEAINHTAKLGEVQGPLADALEWSGITTDDFNAKLAACNTESEREALIRETLTSLYGEAATVYEANNAQVLAQRDAQAALQEKLAALGTALAPLITAFTSFATDALGLVMPYVQNLGETLIPILKTALEGTITAIQTAAQWIREHTGLLQAIGVAIGVVVAAIGMYNAVAAIKAAMAAAEVASLGALIAAYAAQAVAMMAAIAPYVLIAAAIAAVIAIIVVCVKHWDEIKAAAKKAWEAIKQAWQNAGQWFKTNIVDKIKQVFANIGEWFKTLFTNAWNGIKNAWSGVKAWFSSLWDNIKNIFSVVGSWFSGIFTNAKTAIQNAFSGITTFFSGIWNSIKTIFSNVGTAIANGIKGAVSSAVNSILTTAAGIINGFIGAINVAIGIINAIPGVNISKLNKISVPAMAQGGVVNSATLAVIGEQGKEMVLPLENNLQYLDKLAGMLAARMGGGNKPIVLQIDGKTFAQTTIDSINQLTKQTGTLGLTLA